MPAIDDLRADVDEWCRGRLFSARLPLLLWFAWVLVGHLGDPEYQSLIGPLNFGIHELGHFVFALFGRFMGVLGGSLFQCLVPLIAIEIFRRQRDYFAIAFAFAWLSTNLFYVATYVADAFHMNLPLVSPGGGEAVHDWNFILSELELYDWDTPLAAFLRFVAVISMLIALAGGSWLVWKMFRSPAGPGRTGRP